MGSSRIASAHGKVCPESSSCRINVIVRTTLTRSNKSRRASAQRVCLTVRTVPSGFGLIEAKMNVLQDENFERQKGCLSVSVQKYLAVGNVETAKRLIVQSYEEYQKISNEYWRIKWLSTLETAIEMLVQQGRSHRHAMFPTDRRTRPQRYTRWICRAPVFPTGQPTQLLRSR